MNIYGKKVILRALEYEDLELIRETVNDPQMEKMVVGWSFPISINQQKKWYESQFNSNTNFKFAIEYNGTMIQVDDLNFKQRMNYGK